MSLERDDELVGAARAGDDRAFEQLYARYRPQIRGLAHRLTRDPDRAEDITQEVFISALRRMRETDGPIAFRPWIYEIARNACIDEHRRSVRVQEVPIERDGEISWYPALTPVASPELAIESKQRLADLCGALRGLSDRHHRVIVLRELEGMSYAQIGDELGMTKPVVESTLFRARRKLSQEYDDLTSGRRCDQVLSLVADGRSPHELGVRERRAVSSHLEHCAGCRREAYAAGWQDRAIQGRRGRRAAAFLPVPCFRARLAALLRGAHHATVPTTSAAARYVDVAGPIGSGGRAAATAASLVLAVVGGTFAASAASRLVTPLHVGSATSAPTVLRAPRTQVATAAAGRPSPARVTAAGPRQARLGVVQVRRVLSPAHPVVARTVAVAPATASTPGSAVPITGSPVGGKGGSLPGASGNPPKRIVISAPGNTAAGPGLGSATLKTITAAPASLPISGATLAGAGDALPTRTPGAAQLTQQAGSVTAPATGAALQGTNALARIAGSR